MSDQDGQAVGMSSEFQTTFALAEYASLRAEIIKRIDIQHQLISLTLLVAGTVLSIGLQTNIPDSASVLLIYPVLALFLAAAWAHNGIRIVQLARYIRDTLEQATGNIGWEKHLVGKDLHYPAVGLFAARGVFVSTQVLAVGLALLRQGTSAASPSLINLSPFRLSTPDPLQLILLAVAGAAILLTISFLATSKDM